MSVINKVTGELKSLVTYDPATGNITEFVPNVDSNLGSNANVTITGGTTGQVLTTDGAGNLSWSSGVPSIANTIVDGNSNVLVYANGNIATSVAGNANIVVVTGTGANVAGTANITGDILAGANVNVAANVNTANLVVSALSNLGPVGNVTITGGTTGQVLTTDGLGVLTWTTAASGGLANGTSNVLIPAVDGNVNTSVAGNANVFVVTGVGANVTGTLDVTANLTAANANISATTTVFDFTVANTANLGANGNITITGGTNGQVLTTDGTGNLSWASGAAANLIVDGNSNVQVYANGNIATTVAGNANIMVVTGVGANITGTLDVTANTTLVNVAVSGVSNLGPVGNVTITGGTAGQVLTTDGSNVLSWTSSPNISQLVNGNSNVIVEANANVNISSNGVANVLVITDTGANILGVANIAGDLEVTGNANVTGNLLVSGNSDLGSNANVTLTGGTSGQVLTTDGTGVLSWTTVGAGSLANGTSSVTIPVADGNVNTTVGGVANVLVVTSTGANVTGTLDATGDISTAGNANITGNATISGIANVAGDIIGAGNANITLDLLVLGTSNLVGDTTVANIDATGQSNLGPVGNVTITGGSPSFVLTTDGFGGLSWAPGAGSSNTIVDGNSNVLVYANGNVATSVAGTPNVWVVSDTGATLTGDAGITGNAQVFGNTSLLSDLTVGGVSNLGPVGNVTITGGSANYVLTTDGAGNLAWSATAGIANTIADGNSNVLVYANSDVAITSNGIANVLVVTSTGANVTGNLGVTANVGANAVNANSFNVTATNGISLSSNIVSSLGDITIDPLNDGTALGNVTVLGNLSVTGTLTYANIANAVTDNLVWIAANNAATPAAASGGGLAVGPSGSYAQFTYNQPANTWSASLGLQANGDISANGVISSTGNIAAGGNITAGNITASVGNFFIGDGGLLGNISATQLVNGNSNVVVYANSDIALSSAGVANVVVVSNAAATISGQIVSTAAGNLATGAGQLYINGTGSSRIDFNTVGTGLPTFTTRSTGTKVVLYPAVSGTAVDYAMGINGGVLWTSVPQALAGQKFSWYAGTTEVLGLDGTGNLALTGNANISGTANILGDTSLVNVAVSGNANIGGTANIVGNTSLVNVAVSGKSNLNDVGNVTILGGTSGQVLTTDGSGVLTWTTAASGGLANGTSNVAIPAADGNVNTSVAGNANVFVVTGVGANVAGTFDATGNFTAPNANIAATTAVFDITVANTANLGANGNVTITGGTTGQVLTTDGSGVLSWTTVAAGELANGVSNVTIPAINGNVNTSVAGNANVFVVTGVGANVAGTLDVTANLTAANANFSATTAVFDFTVANTANLGNVGNLTITGGANGQVLTTDGSGVLTWADNNPSVIPALYFTALASGNGQTFTNSTLLSYGANTDITLFYNGALIESGGYTLSGDTITLNFPIATGDSIDITRTAVANANIVTAANTIFDGTSNVLVYPSGNITTSIAGSANVLVITPLGANVNGGLDVTGVSNLGPNSNVVITGGSAGQVLTTDGSGVLSWTTAAAGGLANGTSNVAIPAINGNVNTSVGGNANVFVVTGTGANVAGTANITGNISTAANITVGGKATVTGDIVGSGNANITANVNANIVNSTLVSLGAGNLALANNKMYSSADTITIDPLNDGTPAGNLVILANVTVAGTLTYNDISNAVTDNLLWVAANNAASAALASGGGLGVGANGTYALFTYNSASNAWQSSLPIIANGGVNANGALSGATTGSFSGAVTAASFSGDGGNLSNIAGANVVGNVTSAITANFANYAGNVTVAAQANITSLGTLTALNVGGLSNLGPVGNVTITGGTAGQVLTTDGSNVLSWTTVASGGLANGTSSITIPAVNGNVNTSVGGTANVLVVTATGANITGTANISGNLSAGNITAVANVTTANLTVNTKANLGAVGNVVITGGTSGQVLTTNGSGVLTWSTAAGGGLANGTSNVAIPAVNGNVNTSVGGVANVVTVTSAQMYMINPTGSGVASIKFQNDSVAIGYAAGNVSQLSQAVAIGSYAGQFNQKDSSIAIGTGAGTTTQGEQAVAIGYNAGTQSQGDNSVAVGTQAGDFAQGNNSVAVGFYAGIDTQGANAIAIGAQAAYTNQSANAIAIGVNSGNNQGTFAIAIGTSAAPTFQGSNAIAIGTNTANYQGSNAIAIGGNAVANAQTAGSIVLNATGTPITASNAGLYAAPVRNDTGNVTNAVYYNTTTKELTYGPGGGGSPSFISNGTSNVSIATSNGNVVIGVGGVATVATITTTGIANTRINPRTTTTVATASLAINSDTTDQASVTALAAAMNVPNPTGTPVDGQKLTIRIKDSGTARALTWGTQFRVIGTTLPTSTVAGKTVYIGCIWNANSSTWDVVSTAQQV